MNWVHCNKCYNAEATKFFLGSCKHILCNSCLQATCPLCTKSFKHIEIGANLPSNISCYFENLPAVAGRLQNTIKFQCDNRLSLEMNKVQKVFPKLAKTQAENATLKRAIVALEENITKDTERVQKLQAYLAQQRRFQMRGGAMGRSQYHHQDRRRSQFTEPVLSTPTMSANESTRSIDDINPTEMEFAFDNE